MRNLGLLIAEVLPIIHKIGISICGSPAELNVSPHIRLASIFLIRQLQHQSRSFGLLLNSFVFVSTLWSISTKLRCLLHLLGRLAVLLIFKSFKIIIIIAITQVIIQYKSDTTSRWLLISSSTPPIWLWHLDFNVVIQSEAYYGTQNQFNRELIVNSVFDEME